MTQKRVGNLCWLALAQAPLKAPFGWRHAGLHEVRTFLKNEIATGAYTPIFEGGL